MKQYDPNGIWPEDLVRYKEILDSNPIYSGLNEEEKVRIADRIMHSTYADLTDNILDKQAAMDIACKTSDGRQFVVEMQTNRKTDFKNRLFYYGASAIHRQVKAGSNKYLYDSVRVIAILDFVTNHGHAPKDKVLFRYEFREVETRELYGTQMRLYMLELPRMQKAIKEQNNLDEWCYMFRNFPKFVAYRRKLIPAFTN